MGKSKEITKDLRFAVLATDTVLLTLYKDTLYVRLIKVNLPPHYINSAGLPGGVISPKETAEQSSTRHIEGKAQIDSANIYIEQIYTFTAIKRDPRNRVIAVAYLGLIPWEKLTPNEQKLTDDSWWCDIDKVPKLAFDHKEILGVAVNRFKARIIYTNIISKILPTQFSLTELEKAYESILKIKVDKRNFRKKILSLGILKKLNKMRAGLKARPAALYKFATKDIRNLDNVVL